MLTDTTDTEVLDRANMERLAAGHDASLNDLMERHATPVFHFLCRMLGNEDDANDLAQETFVRVFRARASFKPGQRFSTWLYTIAANLARNQYRWRARHPTAPLERQPGSTEAAPEDQVPDAGPIPSEATLAAERAAAIRQAVDALPTDWREAVVLCEWEELAVADAAVIAGTTPKAIESRLYRARQRLREELKAWL